MKTATAVIATACLLSLSPAQAQEKLKIGFIATLSGPPAVLGTQLRNGFLLGDQDSSAASSAGARSRSSCRTTSSSPTSR